jgi:uncharacterized membrane protein YgcG
MGPGRSSLLPLALAACLAPAGPAFAVAPEIKDDGKFFSADAIKKANEEIRDIARKYDRDLLVETIMTLPDDQAAKVKAMSREEREKFFYSLAEKRAEAAVVNGVYILVCRDPAHVQVVVTPRARAMLDTQARGRLAQLLVSKFREQRFDDGLAEAVQFVREKLAGAAPKPK